MANARSPGKDNRSPERIEAERIYKESGGKIKLVDIAKQLGLPDNKVRKWKSLDDWDGKKKQVERSTKEKGNVPRKRGGQVGNKNAVGNKGGPGAAKGNKSNLRTGAFSKYMNGILAPDEAAIFQDGNAEEILDDLSEELQIINAKEYRIHKRIALIQQMYDDGQELLTGETKEVRELKNTLGQGTNDDETEVTIIKAGLSIFDALKSLEAELDRVQTRKVKTLTQIENIKLNREKLEIDKKRLSGENDNNKMANAWVKALSGLGGGDNG